MIGLSGGTDASQEESRRSASAIGNYNSKSSVDRFEVAILKFSNDFRVLDSGQPFTTILVRRNR